MIYCRISVRLYVSLWKKNSQFNKQIFAGCGPGPCELTDERPVRSSALARRDPTGCPTISIALFKTWCNSKIHLNVIFTITYFLVLEEKP